MEDEESLETGALVSGLADAVENKVDDFFADGVVAASVVIGSVFFACLKRNQNQLQILFFVMIVYFPVFFRSNHVTLELDSSYR